MNKYKKLQAVAGLINAVDKEIYRKEQFGGLSKEDEEIIVNQYFDAVNEILKTNE